MNEVQIYKKKVAEQAVDNFVRNNMAIGLGSGTTAIWAVRYIATQYKNGELSGIVCGATGPGTKIEALKEGLPIKDLNDNALREFDVVIDGADEFDKNFNLVKGGGGCLLQEKIVAYSAKKLVIIAAAEKQVDDLGISFPVPIEIIPSAYTRIVHRLHNMYSISTIELRKDARNVGPWITESGNYLLDIYFKQAYEAQMLEQDIVQIVGVVETGVFSKKKPVLMLVSSNGDVSVKES